MEDAGLQLYDGPSNERSPDMVIEEPRMLTEPKRSCSTLLRRSLARFMAKRPYSNR